MKHMPKDHPKSKTKTNAAHKPGKGLETMFRVSLSNNQRLSDMADHKAQLMITVNSIILSAVLTILFRKLDDNTYLIAPAMILVAIALAAIVLAIVATRPQINKGTFDMQALEDGQVNLLFFGNYHKMPLADYKKAMEFTMADKQHVYNNLVMDGYAQGVVLGKKYHLLRLSYNVFMFGLLAAVIAFAAAVLLHIDPL